MSDLTLARTVRFNPYRKGAGPSFTLRMFWTGLTDSAHRNIIGYRLVSEGAVLFKGQDYAAHADADSDAAVEGIMRFLTLRPGDTDAEYFASYTPAQLEFAAQHAESLSCEVDARFCCPECGACLDSDGCCFSHGQQRRRRAS